MINCLKLSLRQSRTATDFCETFGSPFFINNLRNYSLFGENMSLYGRTDSNANVTKAGRGIAASSQAKEVLYIDETEAALEQNKERGLNAPGWWSYFTYTDTEGNTRYKAEHMVFIAGGEANADETQSDDSIASDVLASVTIQTQPADKTGLSDPATTNIIVTISTSPGGPGTFQWQKQSATETRWTNVTSGGVYNVADGSTDSTLFLTGIDKATFDGYKFRVKVTSPLGAPEVISDTATLTFA